MLSRLLFSPEIKRFLRIVPFNVFAWILLALYLSPVFFMMVTAMMPTEQLGDKNAPLYPARIMRYIYQGKEYQIYNVPTSGGMQQWALINPGREMSEFIDPKHTQAGLIEWQGNWHSL